MSFDGRERTSCASDHKHLVCIQRLRLALGALRTLTVERRKLCDDALVMLRDLAESDEEINMEPDALARAIIVRETARLNAARDSGR